MAQFTYYTSADSGSPVLTGASGSLIDLLDACLVNGYGAKSAVGWTKPIANTTNPHAGCWRQPSGSGFVLYLNDSANWAATAKEAWATGWETITNLTPPVGTGSGQFPLPSQLLTTGHVVARKSATIDSTARPWRMYADDRTFYLFTISDGSSYVTLFFGDVYSYNPNPDNYKCIIHARHQENNAGNLGYEDQILVINNTNAHGTWLARAGWGAGVSILANFAGDMGKTAGSTSGLGMSGVAQTPNNYDNSLYISPILISEPNGGGAIRGEMRGMYMMPHPIATFSDGQIILGANEYAGKTFQTVKSGLSGGQWVIEISNTLPTN